MRYLKRFNESYLPIIDKIKSEIDDVAYILEDENLNVVSFISGSTDSQITIRIKRSPNETPGQVPTPTKFSSDGYGKRDWLKSLAFNDSYIEFIDRIDEVCKSHGYVIFVNGCSSRFRRDKEIVKYYNFDELYIATKKRPSSHIETFIDVKKAIVNEQRWADPGKIDKGIKWLKKNIVYPAADLIGI